MPSIYEWGQSASVTGFRDVDRFRRNVLPKQLRRCLKIASLRQNSVIAALQARINLAHAEQLFQFQQEQAHRAVE